MWNVLGYFLTNSPGDTPFPAVSLCYSEVRDMDLRFPCSENGR